MINQTPYYQDIITKYPQVKDLTDPNEVLKNAYIKENKYELADELASGTLMEIALIVGISHVVLGYLRYIKRNYVGIGWVIAIIGALLWVPSYIGAPSMINYIFGVNMHTAAINGKYMMLAGFIIACVLSLYKHRWLGLLEPTTLIQIFADILSYLRLYALGLAGGIISSIIFEFATSATFIVGILLMLLGHTLNIVIGIMGGVIHGLRLNFLEWYHYSFEGGGKKFDPLKKLAKEQ